MPTQTTTSIDRKTASRLLKVSVRTIDRYIRRGKLTAHNDNGRIWLDKREVLGAPAEKPVRVSTPAPQIVRVSRPTISVQPRETGDAQFYRDMYDQAHSALQGYQQKLEQSNYRIGQLESQLINPNHAPAPEKTPVYAREQQPSQPMITSELLQLEQARKALTEREKELALLQEEVKREKSARIILAVITYALLALQPIFWYLLR